MRHPVLFVVLLLGFLTGKAQVSANDNSLSKILVVGNSFSYDAVAYLPALAAVAQPSTEWTIGVCMDGSQSIEGHLDKARRNATYLRYSKCSSWNTVNKFPWSFDYYATLDKALNDEQWQLIVFHQVSTLSCNYNSIEASLGELISLIKSKGYKGKFGWLIIPAFTEGITPKGDNKLKVVSQNAGLDYVMSSEEMAQRLLAIAKRIEKDFPEIELVIPCGCAIQIGRKTQLAENGEWAPKNGQHGLMVYKDGVHLQMGIADLLEAWTVFFSASKNEYVLGDIEAPLWPCGDRMSSNQQPSGMQSDFQALARDCALQSIEYYADVPQTPKDRIVVETSFYDLMGRKSCAPFKGLNIKIERHADGSITTEKFNNTP